MCPRSFAHQPAEELMLQMALLCALLPLNGVCSMSACNAAGQQRVRHAVVCGAAGQQCVPGQL